TPITVIHNGVDAAFYMPQRAAVEKFLEEEDLRHVPFRLVMIGQITPRKGHAAAIETFAKFVNSEAPDAQLLIVGTPVFNNDHLYLEKLKADVRQLGLEN